MEIYPENQLWINRSRLLLSTSDGLSGLFNLEAIPSGPFGGLLLPLAAAAAAVLDTSIPIDILC